MPICGLCEISTTGLLASLPGLLAWLVGLIRKGGSRWLRSK